MVTLPRGARPLCWRAMSWPTSVMATPARLPASAATLRNSSAFRSSVESIQLQNVVGRTHQRPFPLYLLDPTQQELPEASRLLDLPNHGLHDRFAHPVDGRAGLRVQLPGHAVDPRRGRRQRATGAGPGAFAMFLLARGEEGVDARLRHGGQLLVRAIAPVGQQPGGTGARLCGDDP